MISVKEAIERIKDNTNKGRTQSLSINDALNHVLAEDILSPINMPPFNQSAMDGYALHTHSGSEYDLIGETKAGDASAYSLNSGQAIRIFTGGMIPKGADAVAKQEIVTKSGQKIVINEAISAQANIRPMGEQIKQGDLAFNKGTFLNAGAVGYLATLGLTHVEVYRRPQISIIATGNELTKPGQTLESGKIYESNTFMLKAALQTTGFDAKILTVHDDYAATRNTIEKALKASDVVLLTGGISVGDYDFVEEALNELGVQNIFYKVKQKPGKPLYFGKKEDKMIFALPGNPAAALSCFYVYVFSALNQIMGREDSDLRTLKLKLKAPYKKSPNLTHFLKAYMHDGEVEILPAQSSAMLSSFIRANCIIVAEEGKEEWNIDDAVDVLILPN